MISDYDKKIVTSIHVCCQRLVFHLIFIGYYKLTVDSEKTMVDVSYNDSHCAVSFSINILNVSFQFVLLTSYSPLVPFQFNSIQVCPGQKLMSVTYPLANPSLKTPHKEKLIEHTGVMTYNVKVEKENRCKGDIKIIAADREIEMKNVPFSKFNVSYLFFSILYISYYRYI